MRLTSRVSARIAVLAAFLLLVVGAGVGFGASITPPPKSPPSPTQPPPSTSPSPIPTAQPGPPGGKRGKPGRPGAPRAHVLLGPNSIVSCTTDGTLPAGDDNSSPAVPISFPIDFYGTTYSSLYVNNNGNLTFTSALGTFTPFDLASTSTPIIAPYFADVDTRSNGEQNGGTVSYGTTTFDGHAAFCATWSGVGYFQQHQDKLDSFQVLLVQRDDRGTGEFDIVFDYDQVQWETGDASGGTDGLGGTSATVGYSAGVPRRSSSCRARASRARSSTRAA